MLEITALCIIKERADLCASAQQNPDPAQAGGVHRECRGAPEDSRALSPWHWPARVPWLPKGISGPGSSLGTPARRCKWKTYYQPGARQEQRKTIRTQPARKQPTQRASESHVSTQTAAHMRHGPTVTTLPSSTTKPRHLGAWETPQFWTLFMCL